MTRCIRRPSSYWTTCKCPPCDLDRRRKAKRARTIGIERVPSDVAWVVMDDLLRRGWTGLAIASACGIPHRSIEGAITSLRREGRRVMFGPTISARIVSHGQPKAGQIGATGARRRLQGLAVQGWDLGRLAPVTGINDSTLAAIRSGATERVSVRMHDAIVAATNEIGMRVGESVQARQNADRKGWLGLLAWEDIDDIDETPGAAEPDQVDPVVVARILAHDASLARAATVAERRAVVAAWPGSLNDLERLTGWRAGRYVVREEGAA